MLSDAHVPPLRRNPRILKARLDAIEAEKLSKEEKATKEATEARENAAKASAEAQKWRVAAKFGITEEDADLYLTATDEDTLIRQAERYQQLVAAAQPGKGNVVPGVGNQPPTPPSLQEQIRAAETAGDSKQALALKSQQLADLAKQNK
ncbi:hypothetical protein [Mycolicibacterium peregrinum]|uniref:hypothetical protein n=1 Tax=Mycolicibacterium peregrinum TaxID=43304 RepID=UPI003AACA084